MFVDTTGRRSKALRRLGLFLGAVCLAYAGVLAAAFMGWGTSLNPSSLLPFGASAEGGRAPGGMRPEGGIGRRAELPDTVRPTASPPTSTTPSASASTTPSAPASTTPPASASAGAN
ncbi:hypothetical protein HKX69_14555 [Streptomyces argyrophyllae]|uniref:Uncharacterized protein n=1 Tax=Streptomyces argyrophylli TaxID=2726118 RepID=A0A6M4PKS0_9ACTN|nr:hypothetical protein [Streptomyces argyrophyllae]QJS10583.1 hypothetical protein HKX69_14555 [Streptomyces argyrophyllae]